MNLSSDFRLARTERAVFALLRAVGTLLLAIAGDDGADERRPASPRPSPRVRARGPRPEHHVMSQPPVEPPAPEDPRYDLPPDDQWDAPRRDDRGDEVERLFADARTRAHEVIDGAVRQAQALLRQQRPEPEQATLERVRHVVTDLAAEVRALHTRLDGIEALLRARPPVPSPPVPPPAEPSARFHEPQVPPPAPPPPPPSPPPEPPRWQAAPDDGGAGPVSQPAVPTPEPQPATPAAEPPPPNSSYVYANGATTEAPGFAPDAGSVMLRISPVAGFQGLMRVQDALTRVHGIREAGVEAYAQGEARLRLQLAERLELDQLAGSLSELLGRSAHIAAASIPDRTLQITIE